MHGSNVCHIFEYANTVTHLKTHNMKLTLREKVIAKMIKNGNNPKQVELMVSKHFAYASEKYKGASKIADVIVTIY